MILTSTKNPKIKFLLSLEKSKERKALGLFVAEGIIEIKAALKSNVELTEFYFLSNIADKSLLEEIKRKNSAAVGYEVDKSVFEKISYRESSGGIVIVGKSKSFELKNLRLEKKPLYLVLESVEKPGNLGAILRTADAAGVSAVIVCDPQTDVYNPNVIRASLGTVFTVPIVVSSGEKVLAFFKEIGVSIYSTYLDGAVPYHTVDYTKPSAIVMGTESTGISRRWIDNANALIKIPMKGNADSMNVSVAAAVVVFEAMRQRGF